jgi:kinesin family member 15
MTSVRVGVRIRPLTSKEESEGGKPVVEGSHPTVGIGKRQFTYDAVFDSNVSQHTLYQQVAPPLLKSFLEGYNATVSSFVLKRA